MRSEASVRQEHILEAAIRRFSHFGVNKTTVAEIADDIGISKNSLFYYYHDKNALLEAVAGKIINEFVTAFETALSSAHTVQEGLIRFIEVKRQYFKKYLLLALQADSVEMNKSSIHMPELLNQAHEKTSAMLAELLTRGVQQEDVRPIDVNRTAALLRETLQAFEHTIKCKSAWIGSKDMDGMFDKQIEVVELLLNGLKRNEWKN